ncbi:MAG: 6-phosphofructokinase [Chloroflexi bacterium RBG_16_63_12]|nr:MAG: 6-phosphofructokinase [Chloroflexi bacterium RBG_16_63_12]
MRRIGILTGGGDAPGLNAVIRAAVKTAYNEYRCEIIGIEDGYDGLIADGRARVLTQADIRGILPRGGTILGTANRGNPFARKVIKDGQEVVEDVSHLVGEGFERLGLDGLIVIGGDGTLRIAHELFTRFKLPLVGVPKTIDNDLGGTDVTFGFDTALHIATEAFDRLHTTAESHHRVMVLELMGRDAGFIPLHAGVAGGADVILIPEMPFDIEVMCKAIKQRAAFGSKFSLVAVSEGARAKGGEQVFSRLGDAVYVPRLGGIGYKVGAMIEQSTSIETRVTVLGHLQRGGGPSPFDRWLGTRFGAGAVHLAASGGWGRMVGLRGQRIEDVAIADAIAVPKRVDPNGEPVRTAKGLGISFG